MAGDDIKGGSVKRCPILREMCTEEVKEGCAFSGRVYRHTEGKTEEVLMCGLQAMVIMVSELNAKASQKPEKIEIPRLYRR